MLAVETHILFTNSNTASWLNYDKIDDKKELLFAMSVKMTPQNQKDFRQRQKITEETITEQTRSTGQETNAIEETAK